MSLLRRLPLPAGRLRVRLMKASSGALNFPGLMNVRDLGGYPTVGGALTQARSLLRSDDLRQLTPEGVKALETFGVETVLDLRWPEELALRPNPFAGHPRVRHVPISLLGPSLEEWMDRQGGGHPKEQVMPKMLQHCAPELARALKAIASAPPGPLLFHCIFGKDRTGLVAALLLALADVVPDAIAHDYFLSGACLSEPYLKRHHGRHPPWEILEEFHCPPEGAHKLLELLAAAGGVRAYLLSIGLDEKEIDCLRARLRVSADPAPDSRTAV